MSPEAAMKLATDAAKESGAGVGYETVDMPEKGDVSIGRSVDDPELDDDFDS